ncbi:MAG: hypothetical protein Q9M91_00575 [Candidatus Dojkabacteria bacterium]|nr:hypothetical protein [Candidatus Dojkabacteria bacterium]MDQ7020324.1 hypothetical protein [Candidatus Dojkabacteria bacterium]
MTKRNYNWQSNITINENFYLDRGDRLGKDKNSSHYFLIDSNSSKRVLISPNEAFIWLELKENGDVKEVLLNYLKTFNKIDYELFENILDKWADEGIISGKSLNIHVKEKKIVAKNFIHYIYLVSNLSINISLLSKLINNTYKLIPKFMFSKFVSLGSILIATIINFFYLSTFIIQGEDTFKSDNVASSSSLLSLLLIPMITIIVHELGHGLALSHIGLKVKRSGFRLVFGIPVFFVDTSDSWMKKAYKRIFVTAAGLIVNYLLAAISLFIVILNTNSSIDLFFMALAITNLLTLAINLIPFLDFDGYYLLIDSFNLPNLKNESFRILLRFIGDHKISRNEILFLFFSLFWTIFLAAFITFMFLQISGLILN